MSNNLMKWYYLKYIYGLPITYQLKLLLAKTLLRVAIYDNVRIKPYLGMTIKPKDGKDKVIILIEDGNDMPTLVHELIHVLGGDEYTCELIDVITGGMPYTESDNLTIAQKQHLDEYKN